jgi:hypothetical protein
VNENRTDESLELIPRSVRDKLDRVEIKLHLKDWQRMTLADRVRLRDLACGTEAETAAYRCEVERLVLLLTGAPAKGIRKPS